jgi:Choline/Carnitine o-acyltransferase
MGEGRWQVVSHIPITTCLTLRSSGSFPPDAYAQMAMQLAWYKVQGCFTAVYETATTQMFIRGRTEAIRSFSLESWLFVTAMTDPKSSVSAPVDLCIHMYTY